jgi:hypothetical protein
MVLVKFGATGLYGEGVTNIVRGANVAENDLLIFDPL